MQEKRISLCTVQAKEVLGDVETLLGLRYFVILVVLMPNVTVNKFLAMLGDELNQY